MNELALFAGAGGGILGGVLLGWRTVCAVEIEPYAASILVARQNDGILPPFPVWDDVCTFDGKPWNGIVDVISGGFPCQDISVAGKGVGINGSRSGLWKEFARIIGEVRPQFVFVENSPMLLVRGGVRVIADLTALGYNSRWGIIGCGDAGGFHQRNRIWIVASSHPWEKRISRKFSETVRWQSPFSGCKNVRRLEDLRNGQGIPSPQLCGGSNGMANYVDRISAIGNGQVPSVAELAWKTLTGEN